MLCLWLRDEPFTFFTFCNIISELLAPSIHGMQHRCSSCAQHDLEGIRENV